MTISLVLLTNLQFKLIIIGLNSDKLSNLKSFMHFRKVQNTDKKDLIERDEAFTNFNFLDDLNSDPIKNSWSIQLDNNKTLVR